MTDIVRLYVRESTGGDLDGYYYDWDGQFSGKKFIILNHQTKRRKKLYIDSLEIFRDKAIIKNSNLTIIFKNK